MKFSYAVLFGTVFVIVMIFSGCAWLNNFQKEGEIRLEGLQKPVKIMRDEHGMAYIYADAIEDAVMAHGFVSAQDRLFQMELTRLFATGRISELVGEKAVPLDTRMRTIGFLRNARKHAVLLDDVTRTFFKRYIEGVNAYILTRSDTFPLEFKLAGITPTPWTIEESLAVMYLMSWNSAANIDTEIIAQMMVEKVGIEKAREIFPININPDAVAYVSGPGTVPQTASLGLDLIRDSDLMAYLNHDKLHLGSNNWAVGPQASPNAKPIVANDPHLDATMLPGPWYPAGIITPDIRMVGAGIPGTPGMVIGRTPYIAMGVTNAYADAQDLYVETINPNDSTQYLEGTESIPFLVLTEPIRIKDKKAEGGFRTEQITIRLTRRGPVISGVMPGLETDKVISMRWAPFETMGSGIGIDRMLTAMTVFDVREALSKTNIIMLNFVFADTSGNIGWQVSGTVPVRSSGDGTVPFVVRDSTDNWIGWIPYEEMPQAYNPGRNWVGTCNHLTASADFPYYYTSHASPSFRYRRLKELLDTPGIKTVRDHWAIQRDTKNLMAQRIAPVMASALAEHEETQDMARILAQWDYFDDPELAAPAIFQSVYRSFAFMVFSDEMGEKLATTMLKDWYFWEERLMDMVLKGASAWFDDITTADKTETRDDLFYEAALQARSDLEKKLGRNPEKWRWGKTHQLTLVSPIRRSGFGAGFLGAGSHPMGGSGETLYRAIYNFDQPFAVTMSASLRMVVDLGDDDKVLAVLPGGVSARMFDPHRDDQVKAFMNGEERYWWFSDRAIRDHCWTTLVLNP
jgi:penicillin amidase